MVCMVLLVYRVKLQDNNLHANHSFLTQRMWIVCTFLPTGATKDYQRFMQLFTCDIS
jgi:hypothetical protein